MSFSISVPTALLEEAAERAAREGISLNDWILQALTEKMDRAAPSLAPDDE